MPTKRHPEDRDGQPMWEYVPGVGWETFNFYFNGRHAATNSAAEGLLWLHADQLGSARLKTNSSGAARSTDRYYPFGEQIGAAQDEDHVRIAWTVQWKHS